jgi:hypothetical protein
LDPQISIVELREATHLSEDDVADALHELSPFVETTRERAWPKGDLFVTFDSFWMSWNPADDALRLAADLINDESFPDSVPEIARRYDWSPRRMNPALTFLLDRRLISDTNAIGTAPWVTRSIMKTPETRRFVRSRM